MGKVQVSSTTQRIIVGVSDQKVGVVYAGPQGPAGRPGESSGALYTQTTASTVWTVIHNLGYNPGGITVLDGTGDLVLGWVATHASDDILILTFQTAVSGTAYIS